MAPGTMYTVVWRLEDRNNIYSRMVQEQCIQSYGALRTGTMYAVIWRQEQCMQSYGALRRGTMYTVVWRLEDRNNVYSCIAP